MNLTSTNSFIVITAENNSFTIAKDSFNVIKTLNNVILKSKYNGNIQYTFTASETTINGVVSSIEDIYNFILNNSSIGGNGSENGIDLSGYAEVTYVNEVISNTSSEFNTALSGKANTSHTHTIANVTNLQTTIDGLKARLDALENPTP